MSVVQVPEQTCREGCRMVAVEQGVPTPGQHTLKREPGQSPWGVVAELGQDPDPPEPTRPGDTGLGSGPHAGGLWGWWLHDGPGGQATQPPPICVAMTRPQGTQRKPGWVHCALLPGSSLCPGKGTSGLEAPPPACPLGTALEGVGV